MRKCKSNELVCSANVGGVALDVVVLMPKYSDDEAEIVGVFLEGLPNVPPSEVNLQQLFEDLGYELWEDIQEDYDEQSSSYEE